MHQTKQATISKVRGGWKVTDKQGKIYGEFSTKIEAQAAAEYLNSI